MDKRFIFFRGLIHTLDLYTDEFVRIMQEHHAECLVLDAAHMDAEMLRLKAFLLAPVTAVISMNNIGLHLELEGDKNVWDQFGIPFYNIMMDHPFHYKKALDTAPEQMVLLCMDRNHVEYVKRFFPNIRNTEFFPHAGIEVQLSNTGNFIWTDADCCCADDLACPHIPFSERKIDVLYAGGLSRYAAEGLVPDLGSIREFDAFSLVRQALEWLIQEPGLTTEYVIERCLQDRDAVPDDKRLGEVIAELRFLDSFAVSFYREQVVRALAAHGITVTIFGAGWDRCEWESEHVVYGGELLPGQVLELMRQSKIVLNTMTWFKRGAHDRIFNGMLSGAAVISDTSEYMLEHFTDGEELRMFSLTDKNSAADMAEELLENPKKAQLIAGCGYRAAKNGHMWKHRFFEVLPDLLT